MTVKRKIQDYVVKSKEIFIGLEDSLTTWKVCVRSEKMIIHEASMEARYSVLKSYLERYPECKVHLVYEAGFRGFNLYYDLTAAGHDCIVVPPHTVLQEKCSRVKSDRIDARLLAKNLEDGNCKSCHVPDKERLADRQLARSLSSTVKEIKRFKNQIRKFLHFHGIESGITAKKWNLGHYRSLRQLEIDPVLRIALDLNLELLEHLLVQQKALTGLLREVTKKERYAEAFRFAESLPGVGWLTAIRLVLELGEDFQRFKTGAAIASFVGLGCSEYSTGESVRRGRITKQGSPAIRSWLIQCAWIAIRRDPALLAFYSRIKQNSGSANKAIVAVARKLIVRMRCCIVNKVEYSFGVIK